MKKIGIFSGTFDPFHRQHLEVILVTKAKLVFDEVWIIPTNRNSDKIHFPLIWRKRIKIISFFIKSFNWIKIKYFGLHKNQAKYEYACETLFKIKNCFPNYSFFYICGDDILDNFMDWEGVDFILDNFKIVIFPRLKKFKEKYFNQNKKFSYIAIDKPVNISSTLIRQGNYWKKYLSSKVISYINDNLLYLKERLLFFLKDDFKRYLHCLFVANRAEMLAKKFSKNKLIRKEILKIRTAAIFHDLTKNFTFYEHIFFFLKNKFFTFVFEPPTIWHQFSAAFFLKDIFFICSKDIFNAIFYHSTGRCDCTKFMKIIFLADKTSEERKYSDVFFLRKVTDFNLELAFEIYLKLIYKKFSFVSLLFKRTYFYYFKIFKLLGYSK